MFKFITIDQCVTDRWNHPIIDKLYNIIVVILIWKKNYEIECSFLLHFYAHTSYRVINYGRTDPNYRKASLLIMCENVKAFYKEEIQHFHVLWLKHVIYVKYRQSFYKINDKFLADILEVQQTCFSYKYVFDAYSKLGQVRKVYRSPVGLG